MLMTLSYLSPNGTAEPGNLKFPQWQQLYFPPCYQTHSVSSNQSHKTYKQLGFEGIGFEYYLTRYIKKKSHVLSVLNQD